MSRRTIKEYEINGVKVQDEHAIVTSQEVLHDLLNLPPGSVYRLRRQTNDEAYTYLLVITKREYDTWEP